MIRLIAAVRVVVGVAAMSMLSPAARGEVPPPGVLQPAPARAPDAPWFAGVSDDRMERAEKLNAEGVALALAQQYPEALEKYRAALREWDHPAIRYNMVRALINLDRPLEAYENLRLALQYDAAPFDNPSNYADALSYRKLLEGQIATIEVSCTEPGARTTLDGQPLLVCPGRASRYILPGEHQVVAVKVGFLSAIRDVVVLAGHREEVSIAMIRVEDAAGFTRRWAPWKPWAVVGGGVLVAGVGGLLQWRAISSRDDYDAAIDQDCSDRDGCIQDDLPGPVRDLEGTIRLENRLAIGGMVLGGAMVVAGVVGLVLNLPTAETPSAARSGFSVHAGASGATVAVSVSF